MKNNTRNLVLAGMFIALGILLPFITGQNYQLGQMLSPMHIPVLLCGFICGWPYGLAVGFITPLLRCLLLGAPPLMTAIPMAFELAVYGILTGIFYRLLPKKKIHLYSTLVIAMVCGRIVWGIAKYIILGIQGTAFTWQAFITGAVLTVWPAIIIQIVLIPAIMMALERTNALDRGQATTA